jgi:phosphonate transport system substrate-binding protein|tara:strand:+ start:1514 stop:2365 length:852 start_codon:yes stop_codon:yes gene_type:complete
MKKITERLSLLGYVLIIACLFGTGAANAGTNPTTFNFGVVPQQSPAKLLSVWHPILDLVFKKTGIKLEFKTAVDIPAFEAALASGIYDFSYMNPYHYTHFNEKVGYKALVSKTPGKLAGLIVVHKDSPYQSLEDLAGTRMVFPSPAAFAASLLTRLELQKRGINVEVDYVRSHDSVYANVAKGFAASGGGVERTLAAVKNDIGSLLRVIWRSPEFYSHPIAVHPRVPEQIYKKVQKAFIELSETEQGKAALSKLRVPAFAAVENSDYDEVRALDWKSVTGILD